MFCPKCSQEQISDEIRFCSKCGFSLIDVGEALRNDGKVDREVVSTDSRLKSGVLKGTAAMTIAAVFFILSLIIGTPEPSLFVQFNLLVGLLVFVGGLSLVLFRVFRSKGEPSEETVSLGGSSQDQKRLSATETPTADEYVAAGRSGREKEFAPGSVTEATTRNLKNG